MIVLCIEQPQDHIVKYMLYAVVVHQGDSTNSGHYFCYVRATSGIWYCCNDELVRSFMTFKVFCKYCIWWIFTQYLDQIRPVHWNEVKSSNAYILFYELKIDSNRDSQCVSSTFDSQHASRKRPREVISDSRTSPERSQSDDCDHQGDPDGTEELSTLSFSQSNQSLESLESIERPVWKSSITIGDVDLSMNAVHVRLPECYDSLSAREVGSKFAFEHQSALDSDSCWVAKSFRKKSNQSRGLFSDTFRLVCSHFGGREAKSSRSEPPDAKKRRRRTKKTHCPVSINLFRDFVRKCWWIGNRNLEHQGHFRPTGALQRYHRKVPREHENIVQQLLQADASPAKISEYLYDNFNVIIRRQSVAPEFKKLMDHQHEAEVSRAVLAIQQQYPNCTNPRESLFAGVGDQSESSKFLLLLRIYFILEDVTWIGIIGPPDFNDLIKHSSWVPFVKSFCRDRCIMHITSEQVLRQVTSLIQVFSHGPHTTVSSDSFRQSLLSGVVASRDRTSAKQSCVAGSKPKSTQHAQPLPDIVSCSIFVRFHFINN